MVVKRFSTLVKEPVYSRAALAPFISILHQIRATSSKKRKNFYLTENDLKNQWDKQKGICPYTGVKMILPSEKKDNRQIPYQASVDRRDNNRGYTPENIQFVVLAAQYAKHTWTDKEIREFFAAISNHTTKNGKVKKNSALK